MMLPLKDKILFAIGGLGENVTFQAVTAWLFFFWSGQGNPQNALVPIGLLGILLGIGRVIEAFDDPLIGHWSDRTAHRMGRRFPFIFFGSPLLSLSFLLLWTLPSGFSTPLLVLYFFLATQFFFFTYTLVSAPYEGILPEIAKTSKDRVSTSAWRVFFGVIGAAFGLVGSSLLIERFGFEVMGGVLGIAALLAFWIAILGIRKRLMQVKVVKNKAYELNLSHALLRTLRNRHFLVFSASLVLFSIGFNLLNSLIPFYVTVILKKPEGFTALFSGIVLTSMLIALPIQTILAQTFGKKRMYAYSMFVLSFFFPLLAFVGLVSFFDPFWQTIILTICIGLSLSGQFIFPNAILADVIDYDAYQTGLRREAIYYGMQNTLQKFSFAASSIIFGTTLAFFGATHEAPLGIRLIGPIAGATSLLGFFLFMTKYTLPDQVKAMRKNR